MSNLFIASFLGFIQAVTEFLPVSSSGHLILIKEFFHLNPNVFNLSFDIILHFGTLVALIVFFWKDLKGIALSFFKKGSDKKLFYALIIATIPAILIGAIFSKFIVSYLRGNLIIALMLVAIGIIFIFAENVSDKKRSLKDVNLKDGALIGGAQSLALIPGVSRSGITMVSGLLLGLKREDAARFSFLLSIPTILLVSLNDIYYLSKSKLPSLFVDTYIVGFVVSAVVSFLTIKYFLNYLKKHTLKPFAYYRFILAIVILLVLF